jgi:hypothetical protein
MIMPSHPRSGSTCERAVVQHLCPGVRANQPSSQPLVWPMSLRVGKRGPSRKLGERRLHASLHRRHNSAHSSCWDSV